MSRASASAHSAALRVAVDLGRGRQQHDADRGARHEAGPDGAAQERVVAGWPSRTARAARPAPRRRRSANVSPRSSNASGTHSGGDEERGHGREHRQPDGALLRVDHAREPGVADPGPPQHPEGEQALGQPLPRRIGGHERRALGDGQHEDEVEEQLERGDVLALAEHRVQAVRVVVVDQVGARARPSRYIVTTAAPPRPRLCCSATLRAVDLALVGRAPQLPGELGALGQARWRRAGGPSR